MEDQTYLLSLTLPNLFNPERKKRVPEGEKEIAVSECSPLLFEGCRRSEGHHFPHSCSVVLGTAGWTSSCAHGVLFYIVWRRRVSFGSLWKSWGISSPISLPTQSVVSLWQPIVYNSLAILMSQKHCDDSSWSLIGCRATCLDSMGSLHLESPNSQFDTKCCHKKVV